MRFRNRAKRIGFIVAAALIVAACGSSGPTSADRPDDGELDPELEAPVQPTPAPTPMPSTTEYAVVAGDTLGGIAARFDITVDEILEVNDITVDTVLNVGDIVIVPVPPPSVTTEVIETDEGTETVSLTAYTVVAGDTLGTIAARFETTIDEILEANDLTADVTLEVGQMLNIPVITTIPIESPEGPVAAPGGGVVPIDGYTVVAGDTLGAIAARLGLPVDSLLEANGLTEDAVLQVGQVLEVPEP